MVGPRTLVGLPVVAVGLALMLNACTIRQLGQSGAEGVLDETMRVLTEEDDQLSAIAADPTLQRAIADVAAALGRGTAQGLQDVERLDAMAAGLAAASVRGASPELLALVEDPRFQDALEQSSAAMGRGFVIGSEEAVADLTRARGQPRSMFGQLRNLLTIERVLAGGLRLAHVLALIAVAWALLRAVRQWTAIVEQAEAREQRLLQALGADSEVDDTLVRRADDAPHPSEHRE